jgi:cell wall-associated NlpC family hydrolase
VATALVLVLTWLGTPVYADSVSDSYVVQPGDTLSSIAAAAGVSVDRIVELNGLESPDVIYVGDSLVLAEPTPVRVVYRVEAGDTLSSVSRQFGVGVAALVSANVIEDPNQIAVGTELVIPDQSSAAVAPIRMAAPVPATPTPTPQPTVAPPPAPPAATPIRAPAASAPTASIPAEGSYVVQQGDTLYSIARARGLAPAAIVTANRLASADHIFVGQRLIIPARAAPQSASVAQPAATNDVVALARQYLGAPYLFGGTTPSGFDCSGFIYWVFTRAGRGIERDIWSQYDSGPHVAREQLQPGDLVFFQNTYMPGLSHNGIYVGNGQFINAVDEDSGVAVSRLTSPYWAERWYGATRPRSR